MNLMGQDMRVSQLPQSKLMNILYAAMALLILASIQPDHCMSSQEAEKTRAPAVAGAFYPKSSDELREVIKESMDKAQSIAKDSDDYRGIKAIMAPHAGYFFCKKGLAAVYQPLKMTGFPFKKVFIIGPSHRYRTKGGALSSAEYWRTPLGKVPVDEKVSKKIVNSSDRMEFDDRAHAREHSIEVQLPYLMEAANGKDFKIIPILINSPNPADQQALADSLAEFASDPESLVIISTDLSHYPKGDLAESVDKEILKKVVQLDPKGTKLTNASIMSRDAPNLLCTMCGLDGVIAALKASKRLGIGSARLVDYSHSGEASNDNSKVVGYGAVLFYSRAAKGVKTEGVAMEDTPKVQFSEEAQRKLLSIAKSTVEASIKGDWVPFDKVDHPELQEQLGCFVTLKNNERLRGCIGRFTTDEPLWKTVQEMAVAAATRDVRFRGAPITTSELKDIDVEISVLSNPELVKDPIKDLRLGRDGIIVEKGVRRGVFLPQVATETGWNLEEFLGHCAQDKAGIGWDGWKDSEAKVYSFTATIIE